MMTLLVTRRLDTPFASPYSRLTAIAEKPKFWFPLALFAAHFKIKAAHEIPKKPEIVEAVQWTGENWDEITELGISIGLQ